MSTFATVWSVVLYWIPRQEERVLLSMVALAFCVVVGVVEYTAILTYVSVVVYFAQKQVVSVDPGGVREFEAKFCFENGRPYFTVEIDGEQVRCKLGPLEAALLYKAQVPEAVLEASVPNSHLAALEKCPSGMAIFVRDPGEALRRTTYGVVTRVRIGKTFMLMTALHVVEPFLDEKDCVKGAIRFVKDGETKDLKVNLKVRMRGPSGDPGSLDFCLLEEPSGFGPTTGIKALATSNRAFRKKALVAFSVDGNGRWFRAQGRFLERNRAFRITHSVSTTGGGSSGCALIQSNRVIGVHCGQSADRASNFGVLLPSLWCKPSGTLESPSDDEMIERKEEFDYRDLREYEYVDRVWKDGEYDYYGERGVAIVGLTRELGKKLYDYSHGCIDMSEDDFYMELAEQYADEDPYFYHPGLDTEDFPSSGRGERREVSKPEKRGQKIPVVEEAVPIVEPAQEPVRPKESSEEKSESPASAGATSRQRKKFRKKLRALVDRHGSDALKTEVKLYFERPP